LEKFIGKELVFQYAWLMDEDDKFPGVWALTTQEPGFPCWVPEFDLKIVEVVSA
jgi:hypothetical protein